MTEVDKFLMLQEVREIEKDLDTARTLEVMTKEEAIELLKKIKLDET
jgi:hypothetical protein